MNQQQTEAQKRAERMNADDKSYCEVKQPTPAEQQKIKAIAAAKQGNTLDNGQNGRQ